MTPVDIESFAGARLDTDIGAPGFGFSAQSTEVIFNDRFAAVIAQGAKALRNNWRVRRRVLLEQFGDCRLERVEFAGAVAPRRWRRRRFEVLDDGAPADVQWAAILRSDHFLTPCRR